MKIWNICLFNLEVGLFLWQMNYSHAVYMYAWKGHVNLQLLFNMKAQWLIYSYMQLLVKEHHTMCITKTDMGNYIKWVHLQAKGWQERALTYPSTILSFLKWQIPLFHARTQVYSHEATNCICNLGFGRFVGLIIRSTRSLIQIWLEKNLAFPKKRAIKIYKNS